MATQNECWQTVLTNKEKKKLKKDRQKIEPPQHEAKKKQEANEVSILKEKIKSLEQRIIELENSMPQPCPQCGKCVEPVYRTTKDRWTGGTGCRLFVCPSCDHMYSYTM